MHRLWIQIGFVGPARIWGEIPPAAGIWAIRRKLKLTRTRFAARFGLEARTVQEWEQRRRRPDRAARAYLTVISRNPDAAAAALGSAG